MSRLHPDELPTSMGLARRLVDEAFPAFSSRLLTELRESGSSNRLFRLGSDMLVRLPRQPGGSTTIDKEARWLPFVEPHLSVAVPELIGVGGPALGYPERWAITTWLDGTVAVPPPPGSTGSARVPLADDLARLVDELRSMEVPGDATTDESLTWYRGERLATFDDAFRESVADCRNLRLELDLDDALRTWDRVVEASREADSPISWYHGDLLAENLLLDRHGRLSAVLDFGGLAVGDPAVDLVVAWELLDDEGRGAFRRALDLDDALWAASRGWALFIAMMTFPYYGATMPRRCADRLAMARAALSGA